MDLAGIVPWLAGWAMVFGPLTSWYARRRARQPLVWLVYGAIIGPAAGLILAGGPPGRCPVCDEPATGLAIRCPSCGTPYDRPLERWVEQVEAVALEARATAPRVRPTLVHPPSPPTPTSGQASGPAPPSAAPPPAGVPAGTADAARAGLEHQAAAPPGDGLPTSLVASGVLLPGGHSLTAGVRYLLARHGQLLWVLGPIETTPSTVRFERSLERVVLGARADDLQISTRGQEPDGPSLVFASVVSLDAAAVADLIGEAPEPTL
ncbi:MAG TPA: hypothetical protein VFW92_02145 [Candidatus Limnocylindrales bacterium]|nr:hypothetical protein [Candidatus Limnocylindrales bacterium]